MGLGSLGVGERERKRERADCVLTELSCLPVDLVVLDVGVLQNG